MAPLLRFTPALIVVVLFLIGFPVSKSATLPEPAAHPAPSPEPAPWSTEAIDAATKKLEEQKETLGTEMKEMVDSARANGEEQAKIAQQAAPVAQQLDQATAAITATEGEFNAHSGRCHNGQLEQSAYNSCVGEHSTIASKYEGQVSAAKELAKQLKGFETSWKNLQAQNAQYQKRWETMKEQRAKIEQQIAKLAELKSKVPSCNAFWSKCTARSCPPFAQEGLKHCYSVFWDGAELGLPPLPENPRVPFSVTPNDGGSSDPNVVDSRGVKKMTAAEREAELKKPRVHSRVGEGSGTPPPPPQK